MGKFINTKYYDTNTAVVSLYEDLIKNPFYLFNDKKGTSVEYYNMNTEKSTLDEGSKLSYDNIGKNTPLRFNKIHDLFLYQFNRAELNLENEEFGLAGEPITGESYILPNTIIPYSGDYFEVQHIKNRTYLFRVDDVNQDTLPNGNNVYKINWSLDRHEHNEILENVVDEFQYLDVREGTNIKSVVKSTRYEIARELDEVNTSLKSYFIDLFYEPKVQTFIYHWYNEYRMYDPFAIEFIIRNSLLKNDGEHYLFVDHKTSIPRTFSIDYDRSIFRAFEKIDKTNLRCYSYQSQADYIDDATSIFSTQFEEYFALNYRVYVQPNTYHNQQGVIPIMDEETIDKIINNELYDPNNDQECKYRYRNLYVKYFNNYDTITKEDIKAVRCIDKWDVRSVYYDLLFTIFCIDRFTQKLLS